VDLLGLLWDEADCPADEHYRTARLRGGTGM